MDNKNYYTRKDCRLCTSHNLEAFLEFPSTPIGDNYLKSKDDDVNQQLFPLDIYFCHECGHVQMNDIVNPELIYRNYIYETSNSLGLVQHFKNYADKLVKEWSLEQDSLIVDIGCNDASMLKAMKENKMRVVGVEPAIKIAEKNNLNGIDTYSSFFTSQLAQEIVQTNGHASLVTANNVMANIDDLDEFAAGIKNLLTENGLFVFESGYAVDTLKNSVLDNFYHEHISYFRVNPIIRFFKKHGLEIIKVEHSETKGGSIRCFFSNNKNAQTDDSVDFYRKTEYELGFENYDLYKNFSENMLANKSDILKEIDKYDSQQIVGFGASVGVTSLIYYFNLLGKISFLVDDNIERHGMLSPGANIKVLSPEKIYEYDIKLVVLFPWRYEENILNKHKFNKHGYKVLVPLPTFRLLNS